MDQSEAKLLSRLKSMEAASVFKIQIRAEVYKSLLKKNPNTKVNIPKADVKRLKEAPKSGLYLDVIRDFLSAHECSSTMGVFKLEAELTPNVSMKKTLEDRCGVKTAPGQSILEAMLDKLKARCARKAPEISLESSEELSFEPKKSPGATMLPGLRLPSKPEPGDKVSKVGLSIPVLSPVGGKRVLEDNFKPSSKSKFALMQLRAEKEARPVSDDSDEAIEEDIEEEPIEIIKHHDSNTNLADSQGTSSMGADASADSMALESCDHVEKIPKSMI